jgi:transcriptional regulator of arginine metabolism
MKKLRHEKIIELVTHEKISSQEALLALLSENEFVITQATLSRDLAEIGIVKKKTESGFVYMMKTLSVSGKEYPPAFFSHGFKSVNTAGNIIVIKTEAGLAGAACVYIESLKIRGIMGTIAGDDTIFAAAKTPAAAAFIQREFTHLIGLKND